MEYMTEKTIKTGICITLSLVFILLGVSQLEAQVLREGNLITVLEKDTTRIAGLISKGAKIGAKGGGYVVFSFPESMHMSLETDTIERDIKLPSPIFQPPRMVDGRSRQGGLAASTEPTPEVEEWTAPWKTLGAGEQGGVVVGIIDTGLWLEHPAFLDSEGNSRVLYYWAPDATAGGHIPSDMGYGRECMPRERGLADCEGLPRDNNGHGTHVASVAVGGGEEKYWGVYPTADIIFVSLGQLATSAEMANAVHYIFSRADRLGVPAVINLSYGSHIGPHDGNFPLNSMMNDMTGPGRLLVVSAGNDGRAENLYIRENADFPAAHHMEIQPLGGKEFIIPLEVFDYTDIEEPSVTPEDEDRDFVYIETWLPASQSVVEEEAPRVTLRKPDGGILFEVSGKEGTHGDTMTDGTVSMVVDRGEFFGGSGDRWHVLVYISSPGDGVLLEEGVWNLEIETKKSVYESDSHAETWLAIAHFGGGTEVGASFPFHINRHLIGSPGSASKAITVGGWTNAPAVPLFGGDSLICTRCSPKGDFAFFSSPGPTTAGELKPEITAPADFVVGARVPGTIYFPSVTPEESERAAENPLYGFIRGTSQAAPQVAGVLGRMLRLDPSITPEKAEQLLAQTAEVGTYVRNSYAYMDPAQGRVPNFSWGYGKIGFENFATIFESSIRRGPLVINLKDNPVRIPGGLYFRISGGWTDDHLSMAHVYDLRGRKISELAVEGQRSAELRWDLQDRQGGMVPNGVYVLVIETKRGERAIKRFVVAVANR